MTTVIFADTLLIVNFSMDFLALYLSARLMHSRIRTAPMAAAALIGAGFALAAALYDARFSGILWKLAELAAWIATAFLMVRIAFGGGWRAVILFGGVSIGLGGLMSALFSLVGRLADSLSLPSPSPSPLASPLLFLIIAALSGAVSLLWGRSGKKVRRRIDVTVRISGGELTLPMLIDSGNLLREPIGGRPVIVVAASRIAPILPDALPIASPTAIDRAPPELAPRLRLIPAGGVTGGGLLLGILPERICAAGRELDAVIAIDPRGTDYGGCGGIIPDLGLL